MIQHNNKFKFGELVRGKLINPFLGHLHVIIFV